MKISSFFKPVIRQWSKLSSKKGSSLPFASAPRASRVTSTSTPTRVSPVGSATSVDSFSSRFATYQDSALYRAYVGAMQAGAADPWRAIKADPLNAVATERKRVTGLVATHRAAQQNHIKAKDLLSQIDLKLHQAEHEFGVDSTEVAKLKSEQAIAVGKLDRVAADLFLAKIAFVS